MPVSYDLVAPGYFETLRIPVLAGRSLDARDRRDSPPVVVISRTLARALWGEANALGRTISIPDPPRFLAAAFTESLIARGVAVAALNSVTDRPA